MANLSNINNILRTGSLGVGINRDPLGAFEISSATKPGIKMFNTAASGKTYEAYSDANGNYIIYDQDADDNRLVINSAGNATFSGTITSGGTIYSTLDSTFSTDGSISRNATVGLVMRGVAGSVFDLALYGAGGTALMTNSTGTNNIVFNSGNVTVAGSITGTRAFFNSGTTNVVATFTSTDGTAGIGLIDSSGSVELSASGDNFQVQPAGGAAQLIVGSTGSTFAGLVTAPNFNFNENIYKVESAGATRGLYSVQPHGGDYYTQASTKTGYLKIVLPITNNLDDMIKFTVDIYLYGNDTALTAHFGGYVTGSLAWGNTTATIMSGKASLNYTVRFGNDGTNFCVYIGESNTTWSYPQVVIRNFFAGYGAVTGNDYLNEWAIDFTTTLGTISETRTNNFPLSSGSTSAGVWTVNGNNIYNSNSGNVGIGVTVPGARLELDNPSAFTNMIEYGNVAWNQSTGHGLVAVNRGSDGYVQLQITSGVDNADVFTIRNSGTGANIQHNFLSNGNAYHAGNVGIKTQTPYSSLSVIDSNSFGYFSSTSAYRTATFQGSGSTSIVVAANGNSNGIYSEIRLGNTQATYANYSPYVRATQGDGIDSYSLEFGTSSGGVASTKMYIGGASGTTLGNVGIGTTLPEEKLHVVNAANASVDNFMLELQNTTTVPDSRSGILFSTNNGTGSSRAGCAIQGSNNGIDGTGHLLFGSVVSNTFTERMRIRSGGEVNIGNTGNFSAGKLVIQQAGSENGGILTLQTGGTHGYYTRVCHNSTSVSQAGYWHIKTNIPVGGNIMFLAKFYGYIYGSAQVLDLQHVGYAYSGTGTVINQGATNNGSNTNSSSAIYSSANGGKVTFRIAFGAGATFSTYYAGVYMDMAFPSPAGQGHDFQIEAQSFSQSTTVY